MSDHVQTRSRPTAQSFRVASRYTPARQSALPVGSLQPTLNTEPLFRVCKAIMKGKVKHQFWEVRTYIFSLFNITALLELLSLPVVYLECTCNTFKKFWKITINWKLITSRT